MHIKKIYLAEDLPDEKSGVQKEALDYGFMNTDVIVQLDNKNTYRANFITLKKLVETFNEHQNKAEDLSKEYLWSKNMVITKNLEKKVLKPMVEHMIEEGDFQLIFEKL